MWNVFFSARKFFHFPSFSFGFIRPNEKSVINNSCWWMDGWMPGTPGQRKYNSITHQSINSLNRIEFVEIENHFIFLSTIHIHPPSIIVYYIGPSIFTIEPSIFDSRSWIFNNNKKNLQEYYFSNCFQFNLNLLNILFKLVH